MKSVIYLQFTANVIESHEMMALILVFHAHLSVFHDEMIIWLSHCVSIWMKLFKSLVRIQIFLIAFSHKVLSTNIV
jgi:hypothetical protein